MALMWDSDGTKPFSFSFRRLLWASSFSFIQEPTPDKPSVR